MNRFIDQMSPRFEPRLDIPPSPQRRLWDDIDIDASLQAGSVCLPMALAAARAIYGASFNPQNTLKALAYVGDGDLTRLAPELLDRSARAIQSVDPDRLPDIDVQPRRTDSPRTGT